MWVKRRHGIVFFILRPFVKIFLFFKIGYKYEKYKGKEPVLILSNHTLNIDFFCLATSFNKQIYFLATDDIFNLGFASKIIKYLVNPIPKTKSKQDLESIKTCLRVAKEKGNISIFPEGNRTFDGTLCNVDVGIAKLAKKINYDVVLYTISGGYQSSPRFGNKIRKGKVVGKISKIITKEVLKTLDNEELTNIITSTLNVDLLDHVYKGKRKAEYLERCIYYCTKCNSFNTMVSNKNEFYCCKCSNKYEFNKQSYLINNNEKYTVNDLYQKQNEKIRTLTSNDIKELIFEDEGKLYSSIKGSKEFLCKTKIKLENNMISIGKYNLNIDDITSVSLLGGFKIRFFTETLELQFEGHKRFCGLKYMNVVFQNMNLKKEENSKFLGL